MQGPVVQYIQRPDFDLRIQESEHPAALLYNRSSVKHMISRIKRDPLTFERYQHNRDLVALINSFASHERDLPPSWESRLDANGKVSKFISKIINTPKKREIGFCCIVAWIQPVNFVFQPDILLSDNEIS